MDTRVGSIKSNMAPIQTGSNYTMTKIIQFRLFKTTFTAIIKETYSKWNIFSIANSLREAIILNEQIENFNLHYTNYIQKYSAYDHCGSEGTNVSGLLECTVSDSHACYLHVVHSHNRYHALNRNFAMNILNLRFLCSVSKTQWSNFSTNFTWLCY